MAWSIVMKLETKATTSALLKDLVYFTQKKPTFSILHQYFYKIPTSIHLLYTIFYINNIFISWRERESKWKRECEGREIILK